MLEKDSENEDRRFLAAAIAVVCLVLILCFEVCPDRKPEGLSRVPRDLRPVRLEKVEPAHPEAEPPQESAFGSAPRSPEWPRVRLRHITEHPSCVFCGGPADQVHHRVPFHLSKELELSPENLCSACTHSVDGVNCHFWGGHCGDWQAYNPDIDATAELLQGMSSGQRQQLSVVLKTVHRDNRQNVLRFLQILEARKYE